MPQPTRSDVHVNKPLTTISIAYIQAAEDFVAGQLFPIVPVMKQSDRYFSYEKSYWLKTGAQKRAPSSESAGGGFHVDNTPNYFCDVWAHHMDIDDQIRSNADSPLDMDRDATMFVTQNLLLRREIQFFGQYFKPSTWTGGVGGIDIVPVVKWDVLGSDPMQDVDFQKSHIKSQTTRMPNALVVSPDVYFALRNNAAVLDRIKYTQTGVLDTSLLASLFGVEKFLVASAVTNTAAEGEAVAPDYILSNSALLVYANKSPSILQPSAGYIFSWQGLFGAGAQGNRIMTFRMEHLKADRVEGEMAFDMKLIGPDLGALFTSVLT